MPRWAWCRLAKALAAHGASVLMLARDPQKNAEAAERVCAVNPDAVLSLDNVDLSAVSSIRSFASRYLDSGEAIDVLMNNDGVMACPFGHTADGFDPYIAGSDTAMRLWDLSTCGCGT